MNCITLLLLIIIIQLIVIIIIKNKNKLEPFYFKKKSDDLILKYPFEVCDAWSIHKWGKEGIYYSKPEDENCFNVYKNANYFRPEFLDKVCLSQNKNLNEVCPKILYNKWLNNINEISIKDYKKNIKNRINNKFERKSEFEDWTDKNNDSCDTRAEVLAKTSLTNNIKYKPKEQCNIMEGKWQDEYSPYIIDGCIYENNDKSKGKCKTLKKYAQPILQIDHTVPLSHIINVGASDWEKEQKIDYANDMTPGHLVPSNQSFNVAKGDKNIVEWLPSTSMTEFSKNMNKNYPNFKNYFISEEEKNNNKINDQTKEKMIDIDCKYIENWLAIKHRWNLKMTKEEKEQVKKYLIGDENNEPICKPKLPDYPIGELGVSYNYSTSTKGDLQKHSFLNETNYLLREDIMNKYKQYCNSNNKEFDEEKLNELIDLFILYPDLFGSYNVKYKNYITRNEKKKICNILNSQSNSNFWIGYLDHIKY